MARSVYDVREDYVGNGNLDTYSFDFKIENLDQLLVIAIDINGDKQAEVRGTDNTFLDTVTFNAEEGGGLVKLQANLPGGWKLILLLANDAPTQPSIFRHQTSFTLKRIEMALDFILGPVQRLAYLIGRTMRLDEGTQGFNPTLPYNLNKPGGIVQINETGDGFEIGQSFMGMGEFDETIDSTDYTGSPDLHEYNWATNKIVFTGAGIDNLLSLKPAAPGTRLMLVNGLATQINIENMAAGEPLGTQIMTGTSNNMEWFPGTTLFLNYRGDIPCWHVVGASGGGAGVLLGLPIDGQYGGPQGPIAGIEQGDRVEDALDKVDTIFGLLSPEMPGLLSSKTLVITGAYTAREAGSGDSHYCTDLVNPEIHHGKTKDLATSFRFGDKGTLSCEVDAIETGTVALTPVDDTGTYGELKILFDFDPHAGVFGKEGFWKGLVATINPMALALGQHLAKMIHTDSGDTSLSFWVDDPQATVVTPISATATTISYKSGVPGLGLGNSLRVEFDVDNFCGTHYDNTRIAGVQTPATGGQSNAPLGGPYNPADTFNAVINLSVAGSQYHENLPITMKGYNSKGVVTNSVYTNNVRVDSYPPEVRNRGGVGQFPAAGYTVAFGSQSDVLTGNEDLQWLGGKYQYPPLVDYSSKIPAGPDYSGLVPGTYANMRWVVFSLGAKSNITSISFNIQGATNFGGSTLVSGIALYVKVEGATGWVDGNAAYPGVGSPSTDGDPALDIGNSTAIAKRVTFGTTPRTGTVYVRIGIPSGSNKTFTGVS